MSTKTSSLTGFLPANPAIRRRSHGRTLRGVAGTMSPSGISNLSLALVGAVVVMAILYIFGINTYAAKGYEIKALQNQISQAQVQSDSLTLKTAELSSMTSIGQAVAEANLIPVTGEEFLTPQSLTAFAAH